LSVPLLPVGVGRERGASRSLELLDFAPRERRARGLALRLVERRDARACVEIKQ
jgi:hypothetical protein